ncbi:hypothetical protein ACA910_017208 [Epithemia clementina (nom. ined.)]
MPDTVSPYERIGIKEEELAIGIDPMEVIEYIGTREDLVEKTMNDIPSFDRKMAEAEVSKFLLDSDALSVFIEFRKRKADDPDFEVPAAPSEEGFFSFRTFVFVYLGYVAYTTVPEIFKNWVRSKEEAGEWNGSGIPALDQWLSEQLNAVVDVPESLSDSVQAVSDVATSLVDSIN